jgi:hypothetical protein
MMYAREPDVITAASKVTTRIRSYWRGNSDMALDDAGVRPTNSDHMDSRQCPTRQSLSPNKSNRIMCGKRVTKTCDEAHLVPSTKPLVLLVIMTIKGAGRDEGIRTLETLSRLLP